MNEYEFNDIVTLDNVLTVIQRAEMTMRMAEEVKKHIDGVDLLVGVGSGVIQDLCKYLSFFNKIPYIVYATAPSMDGYASATSSMSMDGLKVSLNSRCADVIIGDIDNFKKINDTLIIISIKRAI